MIHLDPPEWCGWCGDEPCRCSLLDWEEEAEAEAMGATLLAEEWRREEEEADPGTRPCSGCGGDEDGGDPDCADCDGRGWLYLWPDEGPCPSCGGEGKIEQGSGINAPDQHAIECPACVPEREVG